MNPKLGEGSNISEAHGIRRHVKRRKSGQVTLGPSRGRLTRAGLRSLSTRLNRQITRIVWEGREAERPPLPHIAKTTRRSSLCHVILGSFLLPSPTPSSRCRCSFLKFHKHDSADSMKPIMNEQCLPGLLAIFYKNSMLAAPRPSHLALRPCHLLPRPSHLALRLYHLAPRPVPFSAKSSSITRPRAIHA